MTPHTPSFDLLPAGATPFDEGGFVQHQAFPMRLARSLTLDEHAAADAVQDTLLNAIEQKVRPSGSLRSFLVGILRNRAFKAARGEQRRTQRERVATRPEAIEQGDIAEQLEAQRQMTEVLTQLREPYRETLVLRYLREMTPTAIAAQQGTPLTTVKARLKRGLAEMRSEMGRRNGGERGNWCAALLGISPTGYKAAVPSTLITGGSIVAIKWIMGAVLSAATAGLLI